MDDGYQKNEKEEVKRIPAEVEGSDYNWWYVCGECHGLLNPYEDRCPHCKSYISWNN
jgi:hypothetical protein